MRSLKLGECPPRSTTWQPEHPPIYHLAMEIAREVQAEKEYLEIINDSTALQRENPHKSADSFIRTSRWYHAFNKRAGPLFRLQQTLYDTLHWERPIIAFLLLTIYLLVCFHPTFLPVVPFWLLLSYMAWNYHHKKKTGRSVTDHWWKEIKHSKSIQRRRNMEDSTFGLQQYCLLVDEHLDKHRLFDFSDEKRSMLLVKVLAGTSIMMVLMLQVFPLRYFMASFGCLFSVWFTPLCCAIRNVLRRYLSAWLNGKDTKYGGGAIPQPPLEKVM